MAHKAKSKKKSKKKSNTPKPLALVRSNHKSVDIRNADNGFVVSSFSDSGEKIMIAKTKKEANKFAEKMLGL